MSAIKREFFSFFFVQVGAYCIELATFFCLRSVDIDLVLANLAGKCLALVIAFIGHRRFSFRFSETGVVLSGIRYLFSFFLISGMSTSILWVFHMKTNELIAKILSDVVLFGLSFLVARRFVFPVSRA